MPWAQQDVFFEPECFLVSCVKFPSRPSLHLSSLKHNIFTSARRALGDDKLWHSSIGEGNLILYDSLRFSRSCFHMFPRLVKSHRNFNLEAHCQVVSAGNKGPQIPQGTVRAASKGAHGVCLDAIHRYTVLDVAIPCRAQLKSHHFLNINIKYHMLFFLIFCWDFAWGCIA